jgi:transcriptional regulator with XRE-family HTH domain
MSDPDHQQLRRFWGQRIRARRGARTQADIAHRAGIDQSTLSRIETGDYPAITPSLVLRLAEALGTDPHELCPWQAGVGATADRGGR